MVVALTNGIRIGVVGLKILKIAFTSRDHNYQKTNPTGNLIGKLDFLWNRRVYILPLLILVTMKWINKIKQWIRRNDFDWVHTKRGWVKDYSALHN